MAVLERSHPRGDRLTFKSVRNNLLYISSALSQQNFDLDTQAERVPEGRMAAMAAWVVTHSQK